jgi:PII-like signaling protein
MILKGEARKMKIIIGENERVYQRSLYEAIVFAAKKYKMAGVTVSKGILSYGADNLDHNSKVFALSEDKPIVIEMVDLHERIEDFGNIVAKLMDKAQSGGIIFFEEVEVLKYSHNNEPVEE